MPAQLRVMISSTARDLPEHREEVRDACLQQGMFPIMMEHLPASDAEAISASLKMAGDADIYLLILAHRYGYVPKANNPQQVSVTEMEYDRAVKQGIRRAAFMVDTSQPLSDFTIEDIDIGENATKLKSFKERVAIENIVKFFSSPEDLRAHVLNSLSQLDDSTASQQISNAPKPLSHTLPTQQEI